MNQRKSQLHELLAVESELEGRYKIVLDETRKIFKDKPNLFQGYHKTLELFEETDIDTPEEHQKLEITVAEKLKYTFDSAVQYFDAILQKESTNQVATADIDIDGEVIATNLPATFLLNMESKLKAVREMIALIPTLQVGIEWVEDEKAQKGVWKSKHPDKKYKTTKTFAHQILYEATKEHPAQIEKWEETKNIGMYITKHESGMITSRRKHEYLDKIDKLIHAVKKARQRANSTEIIKTNVAQKMFDYIMK